VAFGHYSCTFLSIIAVLHRTIWGRISQVVSRY
jgi:hypothetical protein